jgi:prephenate dehydrogenase
VAGFDTAPGVASDATARGAIDNACDSVADAAEGAEAIFVAAPVQALPKAVNEALAAAGPDTVVTDVGSTKRALVEQIDDQRFVGGHPLAGAESSGVAGARADLFDEATWYLTPKEKTSGVLYERLHRQISALGARPRAVDAERHDALMAAVSHLPHVFANVLVSQAARTLEKEDERLPATGPSFRDAARVAGSSSDVWTGIYLSNRAALAAGLDAAQAALDGVRKALDTEDEQALRDWNDRAAADRRALLEADLAGGPVHELRVSVPNRPGVVAQVALELGRAGISIQDMALYPAQDNRAGVIALWIAGETPADQAQELAAALGFPVTRG